MCESVITETLCGIPVAAFKTRPSAAELGTAFSHLSDDEMAEFFVTVQAAAAAWPKGKGCCGPSYQWFLTGEHMAECPGSCESNAISIIEGILEGYKSAKAVNHRAGHEAGEVTDTQLVLQNLDPTVNGAL